LCFHFLVLLDHILGLGGVPEDHFVARDEALDINALDGCEGTGAHNAGDTRLDGLAHLKLLCSGLPGVGENLSPSEGDAVAAVLDLEHDHANDIPDIDNSRSW